MTRLEEIKAREVSAKQCDFKITECQGRQLSDIPYLVERLEAAETALRDTKTTEASNTDSLNRIVDGHFEKWDR